jgi:plasmid stability protein
VKNITVAVSDDVYRAARVRAAEHGRSVSGLVGDYLRSFVEADARFALLEDEQRAVFADIEHFRAADRVDRDTLHDRAVR